MNFLHMDTSDSSDEDLINIGNPVIRNEGYLEETVHLYSEEEFFKHFRVSKHVAEQLAARYENSAQYKNHIGQFGLISAYNQILIFFWYCGHQTAGFVDVCDRFNIALATLERIIRKLSVYFSNLSPQIITWPNEEEKIQIAEQFRENGFPNIIGAIDGSHIRIDKPKEDPESYINRKGYYSIQVQVVCDKNCRIRDVFVGYPGSVHDSRIFRNSTLYRTLEQQCGQYFILGDSGYPLLPNLLTPFKDRGQLTERQHNYNLQLAKNRYVVEHCLGILKQKFRQLYHIKLQKIEYIVHLIRALCVLHNIALDDNFNVQNNDEFDENNDDNLNDEDLHVHEYGGEELDGDQNAQRIRMNIVNQL